MPSDNQSELPENWTEAFDVDARDFLYEESRQRLRETIEFGNQQEAKVFALLQISLVLIAASGIFGDLHVELASPAEWSRVVWASILALACWVGVAGLAFTLLNPQSVGDGNKRRLAGAMVRRQSGRDMTRRRATDACRGLSK